MATIHLYEEPLLILSCDSLMHEIIAYARSLLKLSPFSCWEKEQDNSLQIITKVYCILEESFLNRDVSIFLFKGNYLVGLSS
ncbi:hypothetical protein FGO68_gene4107 [Halteria grandinella]|uniref:Uncharacterized protein n=1 Tax=Halteria grandinella TaxID=5974 RepID=A0A8J8P239_HALGN|nr:hypothetical protein FGO68_gene4107 [Halteria grandinella]